jgi:hypothetical protein
MEGAVKQYAETGTGPLSAVSGTQGFFPAKRILSESELAEVIQSIRDIKPTTPFHEKQLQLVIAHLESDISANMQFVFLPATFNAKDGLEHQSKLLSPPGPGQPAGASAALCIQYPVSRGYIHIQSNGTLLFIYT